MSGRMVRAAGLALAILAPGAPAQAATLADRYTSFWVLGDSLSDPGNLYAVTGGGNPPSPPYAEGRFSNGPVWAEGIAADFRARGRAAGNVAFGGARAVTDDDAAPDLGAQLGLFGALSAGKAGGRPLAALWFGANDVFGATADLERAQAAGAQAADAVADGVRAMSLFGVRDFVVFDLPDLGRVPAYALFQPDAAGAATGGAQAFNARLDDRTAGLRDAGLNVDRIEVRATFERLLADPREFGVSDATLPCIFPGAAAAAAFGQPEVCGPGAAAARAFFDGVHPSAVIHANLGEIVEATVAPIPLPGGAPLLGLALVVFAAIARRRARPPRRL